MSLKAGAASVAMIAAVVLATAAPPLWAQQVPPHVLVVGPMVKIDGRLFIEGLLEGLREGAKSGDSDLSQVRLEALWQISRQSLQIEFAVSRIMEWNFSDRFGLFMSPISNAIYLWRR